MNNKTQKGWKWTQGIMIIVSSLLCQGVYADTQPETSADDVQPVTQKDPLEGFNRVMFNFNDHLDRFILKPVATFYNTIMPRPLNEGIHNVYNNINNLPTIANDVLQVNFHQAANDTWRLLINTTVGIGGLFDVASRMQLKQYDNDFGLTLARWGYRNSTYLVLPFFGPKTIRDGFGMPVDYFAFSIYPHIHPDLTRYEVYGLGVVDRRAQLLQYQDVMEEAAVDKYAFVRNAYLQNREYAMEKNDKGGAGDASSSAPIATASGEVSADDVPPPTGDVALNDDIQPATDAKPTDNKKLTTDATPVSDKKQQ